MTKTKFLKSFIIIFLISLISIINVNRTNSTIYEEINLKDYFFSTFLGGNNNDRIYDLVVDSEGNIIIAGITESADYYTINAFQENHNGSEDVFITKLSSDGQDILFSTFLGGSNTDIATTIAIDNIGNIVITGYTYSNNFPTLNHIQEELNGTIDIFLTKISTTGELLFSTYFGGSGWDIGRDISFDSNNSIVITGHTTSNDLPVTNNAYQKNFGGGSDDGFIIQISNDGQSLLYSTFLGGYETDGGSQIEVDDNDNIILCGVTSSENFNTTIDAYQGTNNGGVRDCFLTIFDVKANDIIYSSLFGGNNDEIPYGLTLDIESNIILTGYTASDDFPTTLGAYQTTHAGSKDIFMLKINENNYSLNFSTLLGGSLDEDACAVTTDTNGTIFLSGSSSSSDFPTSLSAFQAIRSTGSDSIISIFDSSGSKLLYSTFNGGIDNDYGYAIALDYENNLITGGFTSSSNFYVINSIQDTKAAYIDNFICKFSIAYDSITDNGSFHIPIAYMISFGTLFILILRRKYKQY